MQKDWQKLQTTRMYLHPPKAERLITVWREGKIALGETEAPIDKDYKELTSAGIWFFSGEYTQADFKESEYKVREDGIPAHKLSIKLGELSAELECVTDFVRKPTCFIKATIKNETDKKVCQKTGYILRAGKESELLYGTPDVYSVYNPNINVWLEKENTWSFDGVWKSGEYFVTCSDEKMQVCEEKGVAYLDTELNAGEEKIVYLSLGKGESRKFDFEEEKAKTVSLWQKELSRINKLPESIKNDSEKFKIIKNLTVQLLQCFTMPVGLDQVYLRQGGMQRRVWTYEAMPVLEGLAKIGDFDDYIEPVIDVYFTVFQEESGEMVPLGIHWAMATGTVLYSFGKYAMIRGKDYYQKYRDRAMKAFDWMKETRGKESYDGKVAIDEKDKLDENYLCVEGLFPPMSACDNPLVFQSWLTTDCNNALGLGSFTEAVEYFEDERAQEVRKEYEEYKSVIQNTWEKIKEEAGDADEIEVPYTPLGNTPEVLERFSFSPAVGFLADLLKMPPCDYEKAIRYYTRRSVMQDGFYNRMPDKDPNIPGVLIADTDIEGRNLIWYVCAHEYNWLRCFKYHNDIERCQQILDDCLNKVISREYYMAERYHQRNPWYAPWSPNASCNGRLINMLLEMA